MHYTFFLFWLLIFLSFLASHFSFFFGFSFFFRAPSFFLSSFIHSFLPFFHCFHYSIFFFYRNSFSLLSHLPFSFPTTKRGIFLCYSSLRSALSVTLSSKMVRVTCFVRLLAASGRSSQPLTLLLSVSSDYFALTPPTPCKKIPSLSTSSSTDNIPSFP